VAQQTGTASKILPGQDHYTRLERLSTEGFIKTRRSDHIGPAVIVPIYSDVGSLNCQGLTGLISKKILLLVNCTYYKHC
jgi:hypothetical protein